MKYYMPSPGETVHCWAAADINNKYIPHKFMLYLGPDNNAPDNILVHSAKFGWNIISMSELPQGKFRSLGVYNIEEIIKDDAFKPIGYVYRFHDNKEPILVTVKLIKGIWKIKKNFKKPSWMISKF